MRRKYFPNVERFKVIETEEDAYWLGFLFTDGNVYKNQVTLKLQPCDRHILESFCTYLHLPFEIIKEKRNKLLAIQLNCKNIANNLRLQGCTERKTFTLQPPNIAEHLVPAFLKGAIDGDGCISFFNSKQKHCNKLYTYKRLVVHFCSASLHFIQWVSDNCNTFAHVYNNIGINKNLYQMQISGKKALTLLQILYSTECPHLHRKYEKFVQAQLHYA